MKTHRNFRHGCSDTYSSRLVVASLRDSPHATSCRAFSRLILFENNSLYIYVTEPLCSRTEGASGTTPPAGFSSYTHDSWRTELKNSSTTSPIQSDPDSGRPSRRRTSFPRSVSLRHWYPEGSKYAVAIRTIRALSSVWDITQRAAPLPPK